MTDEEVERRNEIKISAACTQSQKNHGEPVVISIEHIDGSTELISVRSKTPGGLSIRGAND